MTLYCIKRLIITKNKNIKIKRKIDGRMNFSSRFIDCDFKKLEAIDEKKLLIYLKFNV